MPLFREDQIKNSLGRYRSSGLFKETAQPHQEDSIIATLTGKDKSLPCIRELFIAMVTEDPSEVSFAEEVFGDVGFWIWLSDQFFIQQYVREWREVAAVRMKQKAFKAIIETTKSEGASRFAAAKYLIEEPWKAKAPRNVKDKVKKTATEAASVFVDDIERLKQEGLIN